MQHTQNASLPTQFHTQSTNPLLACICITLNLPPSTLFYMPHTQSSNHSPTSTCNLPSSTSNTLNLPPPNHYHMQHTQSTTSTSILSLPQAIYTQNTQSTTIYPLLQTITKMSMNIDIFDQRISTRYLVAK